MGLPVDKKVVGAVVGLLELVVGLLVRVVSVGLPVVATGDGVNVGSLALVVG